LFLIDVPSPACHAISVVGMDWKMPSEPTEKCHEAPLQLFVYSQFPSEAPDPS